MAHNNTSSARPVPVEGVANQPNPHYIRSFIFRGARLLNETCRATVRFDKDLDAPEIMIQLSKKSYGVWDNHEVAVASHGFVSGQLEEIEKTNFLQKIGKSAKYLPADNATTAYFRYHLTVQTSKLRVTGDLDDEDEWSEYIDSYRALDPENPNICFDIWMQGDMFTKQKAERVHTLLQTFKDNYAANALQGNESTGLMKFSLEQEVVGSTALMTDTEAEDLFRFLCKQTNESWLALDREEKQNLWKRGCRLVKHYMKLTSANVCDSIETTMDILLIHWKIDELHERNLGLVNTFDSFKNKEKINALLNGPVQEYLTPGSKYENRDTYQNLAKLSHVSGHDHTTYHSDEAVDNPLPCRNHICNHFTKLAEHALTFDEHNNIQESLETMSGGWKRDG